MLGSLLLMSGLVCLVAANWEHLGRYTRLGGVQLLLVALVGLAVSQRLPVWGRTLATGSAILLAGVALALVGQTYQTGADPWQLFVTWGLLGLPWAIAGRSVGVWVIWLAVVNVAWARWAETQIGGDQAVVGGLVLLNLVALAALELVWRRLVWIRSPATRRLLAAAVLVMSGLYAAWDLLRESSVTSPIVFIWLVAVLLTGGFYYAIRRDVAVLAMVAASVIGVLVTGCAVWLVDEVSDGVAVFAVLALLVLASSSATVTWLHRLVREVDSE